MSYRGTTLYLDRGNVRISTHDITFPPEFAYGENEDFLKFFVLSYCKLICDSPCDPDKPMTVFRSFIKQMTSEHIKGVIVRYSKLCDELMKNDFITDDSSTRVFLYEFKHTPIFREYLHWYRTGDPVVLRFIMSFLLFGKKISYMDPEFDSTAFRGWLGVEHRLRSLVFSHIDTVSLASIIRVLLPPLDSSLRLPRFGPGKVSERGVRHIYDKLDSLTFDEKLSYVFCRPSFGFTEDGRYELIQLISRKESDSLTSSRLKFVPKDITKSRSICMEPNSYMFMQQDVLRMIRDAMSRGLISRFVNMSDQSENQRYAFHGSMYTSMDTIDLSSASDSVHVDLVRKIFPPDYLYYLLGTRTDKVIVDREGIGTLQVKKFAPMGSAVCFPVQCIIFTAICLYGYVCNSLGKTCGEYRVTEEDINTFLRTGLHWSVGEGTPFTRRYEPPRVFGDDIIIDHRVYSDVVTTLFRLGFEVNESKSFTGSQSFRESCGVYCWQGHDVTPLRFLMPSFREGKITAKVFASIIGAYNRCNDLGFFKLGSFYLACIRSMGFRYPLPFTTDRNEFGLKVSKYTHDILPGGKNPIFEIRRVLRKEGSHSVEDLYIYLSPTVRVNVFEQFTETLVQGIGPRKSKAKAPWSLDPYSYIQWWRSRVSEDVTPEFLGGSLVRPEETRLAPRWARREE